MLTLVNFFKAVLCGYKEMKASCDSPLLQCSWILILVYQSSLICNSKLQWSITPCLHFRMIHLLLCICLIFIDVFIIYLQWETLVNFIIFLSLLFIQGDVLRNNLLVRYFGKSFVHKRETVELGIPSPHPPVTHGPGGNLRACFTVCG